MEYQPFRFISSSRLSLTAQYKDFSDVTRHSLAEFKFIGIDGSYFQDFSLEGRKFPFKIFLTEPNLENELTLWREALSDKGVGKLYHPDKTIGAVNVVVSEFTIAQSPLRKNQVEIDISFLETIEELDIVQVDDPVSAIQVNVTINLSSLNNLLLKLKGIIGVINSVTGFLKSVESQFKRIAVKIDSVKQSFLTTLANINQTLRGLSPAKILSQINSLLEIPSILEGSDVFNFYKNVLNTTIEDYNNTEFFLAGKQDKKNKSIMVQVISAVTFQWLGYNLIQNKYKNRLEIFYAIQQIKAFSSSIIAKLDTITNEFLQDYYNNYSVTEIIYNIRNFTVKSLYSKLLTFNVERGFVIEKEIHPIVFFIKNSSKISDSDYASFRQRNNIIEEELFLLPVGKKVIIENPI